MGQGAEHAGGRENKLQLTALLRGRWGLGLLGHWFVAAIIHPLPPRKAVAMLVVLLAEALIHPSGGAVVRVVPPLPVISSYNPLPSRTSRTPKLLQPQQRTRQAYNEQNDSNKCQQQRTSSIVLNCSAILVKRTKDCGTLFAAKKIPDLFYILNFF